MTEQEIQDIVNHLGDQVKAHAIDLAAARARIGRLERELEELRSSTSGEVT